MTPDLIVTFIVDCSFFAIRSVPIGFMYTLTVWIVCHLYAANALQREFLLLAPFLPVSPT